MVSVAVFTLTIKVRVTKPPGATVNDRSAGLLSLPATPKTATDVVPDSLDVARLGPVVFAPAYAVVTVAAASCNTKDTGNTPRNATPYASPAVAAC